MKRLIYPVLCGLALAGCSQAKEEITVPAPTETAAVPAASAPTLPAVERSPAATPAPARTIIYQGEMDLAVDNFEQATTRIDQLLLTYHAYLGTAHETRANGQHRQEMTLKVAPEEFSPLVAALGKLGRIDNKDVSSADVTADLLDAKHRLADQQAAEARTQQQLAQASSPAETRHLEAQAHQAHLDLAADQARVQQFRDRGTWATFTLRYFQVLPDATPPVATPSFAPRFAVAFGQGWAAILEVGLVLAAIWPLLLVGSLGAWAVRRWHLRQAA